MPSLSCSSATPIQGRFRRPPRPQFPPCVERVHGHCLPCKSLSGLDGFAGLHLHLGHAQDGDSDVVARMGRTVNATQVLLAFAAKQRLERHATANDTYDVGLSTPARCT